MNLERGLRMIAGTSVLFSLILGFSVSASWYLSTACVGLNLFPSGLTHGCQTMTLFKKLGVPCS